MGFLGRLRWPADIASNTLQDAFIPAFAAVMQLLGNASFRKYDEIVTLMERMFQSGVPAKTVIGQSYANIYQEIVGEKEFNDSRKVLVSPDDSGPQFIPPMNGVLSQASGPGPRYSKEESERMIKERYAKTSELIPYTLRRLKTSAEFQKTCSELRARGWKDWHILHSVFTAVGNHRRREQFGDTGDIDDLREQFATVAFSIECEADEEAPLSELTTEKLEFYRQMNLGAILKNWGFELHHPAFTPSVIEEFLAARFGYWTDDVPHDSGLCP